MFVISYVKWIVLETCVFEMWLKVFKSAKKREHTRTPEWWRQVFETSFQSNSFNTIYHHTLLSYGKIINFSYSEYHLVFSHNIFEVKLFKNCFQTKTAMTSAFHDLLSMLLTDKIPPSSSLLIEFPYFFQILARNDLFRKTFSIECLLAYRIV